MATITAIKDRIRQMNAANFQIMCDDYLSRIGYPNLVALGTMAGAEKTTPGTPDTYFSCKDGRYVFAEYTTCSNNIVQKIQSDVEKCLDEQKTGIPVDQIDEIVYCHNSSNIQPGDEHSLIDLCKSQGILLTLIGIDKLADDIFWRYQSLAKEYLNLTIDTGQIQTAEEFVKQYDSNTLAATLETEFVFRTKELEKLENAFTDVDAVIIKGASGVGKTRLALEFAKQYSKDNSKQLYCIHNRNLGLFDDLCMYFEKSADYFILIDDANQLSNLQMIIDQLNLKKDQSTYQLLITVRDYAVDKVRDELSNRLPFQEITIEKFTDDEIKKLVEQNYDIRNSDYLDQIAIIAEGNARIAMMAGKTVIEKKTLRSIVDATELYSSYYNTLLRETTLQDDEKLIAVAGVVAFLGAFHLEHIEPVFSVLEEKGITKDEFKASLMRLHDLEIIDIYYDKAVKFSEQGLANYILKYVFFDKKILPLSSMIEKCFFLHKDKTIFAVNTLVNVFQSSGLHKYVKTEIKTVWRRLKEDNQEHFWEFFKSFHSVDPVETLSILKQIIDDSDSVALAPENMDFDRKNDHTIRDDMINILCGFADTEDIDAALDLFFMYYMKRPDEYRQFYSAAIGAFGIQKDSYSNGYYTQIHFLDKIIDYSDNWNNEYISVLFVEVVKEYLKFEFSSYSETRTGKGITIYHIQLQPSENTTEYRLIVWNGLEEMATLGKQSERIKSIIKDYGYGISEFNTTIFLEEATKLNQLIHDLLKTDNIEDCLIVKHIASYYERYGIDCDEFQDFLNNPIMEAYEVLEGPDYDENYNIDKQREAHEDLVKQYLNTFDSHLNGFSMLLEVYQASNANNNFVSSFAIDISLQELAKNREEYINAVQMLLQKGEKGIDIYRAMKQLLDHKEKNSAHEMICDKAKDDPTRNIWLYSYYHELSEDQIDSEQLSGLYAFLSEDSDKTIMKSPMRDVFFLQKYSGIDPQTTVKASQIIFAKQTYSPFIVHVYFELLFNIWHKEIDICQLYAGDIKLLEDIYFFLLHYKGNPDYDGDDLLKLMKIDKNMPQRVAVELIKAVEDHSLHQTDTRWSILFELENYLEVVDNVVNESIAKAKYPQLYVSGIIKQLLLLSTEKKELREKQKEWINHYISENANNHLRMFCLFDALSDYPDEIKRKSIELFTRENPDFDAFKDIAILPTSWSAFGSFVPVYSRWVQFLESLLPLFSGIKYLEHKKWVLQSIDSLRVRIQDEEISDKIT